VPHKPFKFPMTRKKMPDFYEINVDLTAGEYKHLSYNLEDRFESTDPEKCPIKRIFIGGYIGKLPLDLSIRDVVEINSGDLVFKSLNRQVGHIKLIILAENIRGKVIEGKKSFLSFRYDAKTNSKPTLVGKFDKIDLKFSDDPNFSQTVKFPLVKDEENDLITFRIP
jgi:hypothetical protein